MELYRRFTNGLYTFDGNSIEESVAVAGVVQNDRHQTVTVDAEIHSACLVCCPPMVLQDDLTLDLTTGIRGACLLLYIVGIEGIGNIADAFDCTECNYGTVDCAAIVENDFVTVDDTVD